MNKERFSNKTKYPKIFEKTYWGNFNYNQHERYADEYSKIFSNRNSFVEKYRIKQVSKKASPLCTEFDHIEKYVTLDGDYIVISSNYENKNTELSTLGFMRIEPLYHPSSETFLIKLNDLKSLTVLFKQMSKKR